MRYMWHSMKKSVESYDPNLVSPSGLSGKNGGKMEKYIPNCVSGEFIGKVMATAISVAESNACMKCIVAAPTAGSCGVLPSVLVPFVEKYNIDEDTVLKALYLSAGFGQIIAHRASIAGAEGGCQAEIGSASAMASATLVYLRGGTIEQSANACAFALKSLLGLVCDPVAGLVEEVLGGLAGVGQSLGRKARPGGHRRFGGAVRSRCRGGKRQPGQGHPEQAEGDGKGAQGVKQAENYFPHGENHSFPAGLSSGSMRKNAAPETEAHNFHTGMLYFTGGSVLY